MTRSVLALRLMVVSTVMTAMLAVAPAAQAGCLSSYDDCAGCAQDSLWDGMKSLSPSKIRRANLELADCAIDLYRCILFGKSNDYPCAL